MITKTDVHVFLRRHLSIFVLLAVFIAAAVLYFARVPDHPPGFYIDESSISYNAYTISQTGRDEYGNAWPLFFRAFGEYKNPTFIYLLAAVFRLTGPSIGAARMLSATLGLLCGLLLGLLAWRTTGKLIVALIVAISTLFTPWLFESSRLVFEVAIYPCLIALLLLALWRAAAKTKWQTTDVLAVASALALLTYSYSIGRLLAPLLAVGLAFFMRRARWQEIVKTWLLYALLLLPLLIFYRWHPGALTDRFRLLTYVTPANSPAASTREFVGHYLRNINPWRWLFTGETNVRDHVTSTGSLLAATVLLGIVGLVLVWRNHRREAWWRFILYALIVSVVPASLTRGEFPQLRLIAFPVFFLVLTIPAISWLLGSGEEVAIGSEGSSIPQTPQRKPVFRRRVKRAILAATVLLIVVQGVHFQSRFHTAAPDLWYVFDARFPRKVLDVALAAGPDPIYLVDEPGKSGYIQALWYGALRGLDPARLVRLPIGISPPPGAVVISTEEDCANCRLIARSINYTVYAVLPYENRARVAELSANAFRALITAENPPLSVKAGERKTISVLVKNISAASWPAVGEADGTHAVTLRSRWLAIDGTVLDIHDEAHDGGVRFPYDLEPRDTAGVSLEITAPQTPGEFVLELDVVQEQVNWFSDRGSQPLRLRLRVNPQT
jgi:4-amino-4-deoxy-L-arabinose transferase-like glycosyltransferase